MNNFSWIRLLGSVAAVLALATIVGWRDEGSQRSGVTSPSQVASALLASLVTTLLGIPIVGMVQGFGRYGWMPFVALPVLLGFMAALIHASRGPRSFEQTTGVAGLAALFAGTALLTLAFEAFLYLLVFMTLALPLAVLGGWLAHPLQERFWRQRHAVACGS